ncbi:MAG: 1-deoxy-D-xylulose-5-phosphate reductoisomerase [Alphaproteobacteria bacterium]
MMTAHLRTQPQRKKKRITILGSTGTIGVNALKLHAMHPERFAVAALVAGDNVKLLIEQAHTFKPQIVVVANDDYYSELKNALSGTGITIAGGSQAVLEAAQHPADIVLSAIVGAAGLKPTLAAIDSGTPIALANKESLVCAGTIFMQRAAQKHVAVIPVDSEHNGLFQLFDTAKPDGVEGITLTASGGPFRTWSMEQMHSVTPERAVQHPNWNMGAKISVDSATMMNKGLEMIEAKHLFPLAPDQIDVLVHPQSIVHCLVRMKDGSVLAQMSQPDMCIPIAHALSWPERIQTPTPKLDLAQLKSLEFEAPDEVRFPALRVARAAMHAGGSAPCALNAANEVAVQQFLSGKIGFTDIVKRVERTLEKMDNAEPATIDDVLACDAEARNITKGH